MTAVKPPSGKARSSGKRAKARRRSAIASVGIVVRNASRDAVLTASELTDWLKRRGIEVALDKPTQRARQITDVAPFDEERAYDLVIVLGGDGTLMSVARSVAHGSPILGVNLGRLGFLTETGRSELYPALVRVLGGDFDLEERSLFDVELVRPNGTAARFQAFNDAVIAKSALAHIIEFKLRIDGRLIAHFRADGLIISTPSGSTAYNLSAGGPIVTPTLPVAVMTPICAHALSLRPVVVPDQATIEVVLETQQEEVFLTVDGSEGSSMGYRDRIRVRRAAESVYLVRLRDRTFYDGLRRKLKWGGLDDLTEGDG